MIVYLVQIKYFIPERVILDVSKYNYNYCIYFYYFYYNIYIYIFTSLILLIGIKTMYIMVCEGNW